MYLKYKGFYVCLQTCKLFKIGGLKTDEKYLQNTGY